MDTPAGYVPYGVAHKIPESRKKADGSVEELEPVAAGELPRALARRRAERARRAAEREWFQGAKQQEAVGSAGRYSETAGRKAPVSPVANTTMSSVDALLVQVVLQENRQRLAQGLEAVAGQQSGCRGAY